MTRRLISNSEVLEEMLQDPVFRAEWERTALAPTCRRIPALCDAASRPPAFPR